MPRRAHRDPRAVDQPPATHHLAGGQRAGPGLEGHPCAERVGLGLAPVGVGRLAQTGAVGGVPDEDPAPDRSRNTKLPVHCAPSVNICTPGVIVGRLGRRPGAGSRCRAGGLGSQRRARTAPVRPVPRDSRGRHSHVDLRGATGRDGRAGQSSGENGSVPSAERQAADARGGLGEGRARGSGHRRRWSPPVVRCASVESVPSALPSASRNALPESPGTPGVTV